MAKAKKITKKVVKKKTKVVAKKPAAKKLKSSKPKAKFQKEKKDLTSEIIFDSRVGKTDALFVDEPATAPVADLPMAPTETPEFKIPEVFPDPILDPQPKEEQGNPLSQKSSGEARKKWWQKLFGK